jgi:acyl-homoserine-lactone acylase
MLIGRRELGGVVARIVLRRLLTGPPSAPAPRPRDRWPVRGALLGAIVMLVLGASGLARAAKPRVAVTRDSAGIPHVVAKDFRSLGYGEGFSFAQDNLCTFADDVITLRAQRSRYFGPDGVVTLFAGGVSDPNWKSDLWWQRVRDSGVVERAASLKPPLGPSRRAKGLYRGWVEGYNAYLRSGKLRDPRCRGKPWVKRITVRDLLYRGEQITTAGSSMQFIAGLVDAQPPTGTTARTATVRADPVALRDDLLGGPKSPFGSNGIGLGSRGTKAGTGMVLANPHFPWRGTERFWMAHLTVPGAYDVMGGTIAGIPAIGIGFNAHLAWTHTISSARRFVVFQLKLAPGDPTSYLVDGRPVKMGSQTVTAGGRTHTFYTTRYGVVVTVERAGYSWTNDTAYALGDVEEGNLRAIDQYIEMGRARTVGQLLKTEQRYLGIPSFNTLAADRRGRALYTDTGAIPNVPTAKIGACSPGPAAQLLFAAARVVTLDGSRSECGLENDPGAVAPRIFAPRHLPHLIRRDYVENSNDSYWLANPRHPLTGFSPIIGLERVAQNQRTRQGNLMIRPLLGRFTIERLQRMWENDGNYAADVTAEQLAEACAKSPQVTLQDGSTVDISEACPVIAAYGQSPTGNLGDRGAWLFNEWIRRAPAFTGPLFSDSFDPSRPLTTPSLLNDADPAVLQALGEAVRSLRQHGIPLSATPRQVQHAPQSRRIPIHGCLLCFQYIQAANETPGPQYGPYGQVVYGSSLVMTTELRKSGPRSRAILTYSQATDPTSPWYANMTTLFSRKRWVPMRFTARALARDRGAMRINVPGAASP